MNFEDAIITFMGFKNRELKRCGFETGYFENVAQFNSLKCLTFSPRTWKTDVEDFADQLKRVGIKRVAMLSYSHGQAAARAFVKAADKLDIKVTLWIACDPVARPDWLPRWTILQIISAPRVLMRANIPAPASVDRVVYIRQEKDKPAGSDIIKTRADQVVECAGIMHTSGHTEIDESPFFWSIVREELEQWTNPSPAQAAKAA